MTLYSDSALVLRTWKLGESDRIVSMLSRSNGKIRAVVKGVRKTKSRFGARLEPLSLVSILCWKGRELDVVSQAETIDLFKNVREDLDRLSKASVILESVEHIAQEHHPDKELYNLVVKVLSILDHDNPATLLGSFIWKLLASQGYMPEMGRCVVCQSDKGISGFDPLLGGVLCESHFHGKRVSFQALQVIRMSLDGRLAQVLKLEAGPLVSETESLAVRSLESMLERNLRTFNSSFMQGL